MSLVCPNKLIMKYLGLGMCHIRVRSRKAMKHFGIVTAKHLNSVMRALYELPQALLVVQSLLSIVLKKILIDSQSRWTVAIEAHELVMVEGGISTVELPALGSLHSDAAMTSRVAGQRNEKNLWTNFFYCSDGIKLKPFIA